MNTDFNEEITNYIAGASKDHILLLETLRSIVHKAVPGSSEAIKWGFPVFAKGKDFAYMRYAKKHVTLGFYNFDKIEDPDNKLEGSGNTLRHIKITRQEDIDVSLISQWLKLIAG